MCKICQFIAASLNHLLSLMGNHQKLRMGIKVNAEVYSCHGHISDGKSDEGLGAALTFLFFCWTEKNNPHVTCSQSDVDCAELQLTPLISHRDTHMCTHTYTLNRVPSLIFWLHHRSKWEWHQVTLLWLENTLLNYFSYPEHKSSQTVEFLSFSMPQVQQIIKKN